MLDLSGARNKTDELEIIMSAESITIPYPVWEGANQVNILVNVIKRHGLRRNLPLSLLPRGAFVPSDYKISDTKKPDGSWMDRIYADYWAGRGYGVKATIISKNSPLASKKSQNDWTLIHVTVRFKHGGEKIIIQLNAEEIELILKCAYCEENGEDNSRWTDQVEMILDEAMAEIYTKSPNPTHESAPTLAEKDHKTKNPDEDYRFGKYL